MAFIQSDLEKLEKAIALGVRSVQYQDRKVEYASLDDMLRARELMRKELGVTNAKGRRQYFKHSKGF